MTKLGRGQDSKARARIVIYSGAVTKSGESQGRRDESMMEPGHLVIGLKGVYMVGCWRGFWGKQSWVGRGRSGS